MADPRVQVSVVVPARNAERWAPGLVSCLQTQSFTGWEAIVVDDGSTDSTEATFRREAGEDPRFRVLHRPAGGVSAARNAGIAASRHDWLLFLDADDRLGPAALQELTATVEARPDLELVRCQWAWETSTGSTAPARDPELDEEGVDLFLVAARRCPTAPMAVMVRRSIVEELGGFDTGLVAGEDWDLWQRIGRRGAVSALVPKVLAFYRLTAGSAMRRDLVRVCGDSLAVVDRGHQADPRVPRPRPSFASGAPASGLPAARDSVVLWTAAAALGIGADPDVVLSAFPRTADPGAEGAVTALFGNVPLSAGMLPEEWPELWPQVAPTIAEAAAAFASWLGEPDAAEQIVRGLEARIVAHTPVPAGTRIGSTCAADVDLIRAPVDLPVGPGVERVVARVSHDGIRLGTAQIPIAGGRVTAASIRRAVASDVARAVAARALRHPGTLPQLVASIGPGNLGRAVLGAAREKAS